MKLYEAAGMPPGVINFVPGDAAMISKVLLSHRDLAGVHFTGSTEVFNDMWKTIGASMSTYRSYPRIVGETGGKDFIVAHPSADVEALAVAIVRGGFEFQGQKCSAASRVYVPKSLWNDVRDRAVAMIDEIKMGDSADFRNFMGAVIDKRAFDKISDYVEHARGNAKIVAGGKTDGSKGYFISPTLVETDDPGYRLLCEEIFGPVVTALRLRRCEVGGDAEDGGRDVAVRADRRGVRAGSARDRRGDVRAAARGRQLLHQRQADRRGRRPAAVRRRARLGHQRQGGIEAEPDALGQRADGEGELQPAEGLPLSVHGREDRAEYASPATFRGFCDPRVIVVTAAPRSTPRGRPANIAARIAPPCANTTCGGADVLAVETQPGVRDQPAAEPIERAGDARAAAGTRARRAAPRAISAGIEELADARKQPRPSGQRTSRRGADVEGRRR